VGAPFAIDAWFDFVCPWCLIGHRQLQRALQAWDGPAPIVRWHGVRLVADLPPGGLPFAAFYEHRLGGPEAVRLRQTQVQNAAVAADTRIAFERIARFPDSAAAHRLYRLGARRLATYARDALMQRLFEAYFLRGEDIGDKATLTAIGMEAGLPVEALAQTLWASDAPPPVDVPGVPLFVFQQGVADSGAQPVQQLLQSMRQAFGSEPINA
jgi:predicted DsbA family dithiol-disulfide isomerase